ncbi:hypothetical protein DEIGR_500003 [Deinococcus grandis]|uniref:Uncharacterized protein n=1 Tax=Deinococcus grandis TaxID=57498 RepID=A0A100HNK3_9DEIO|nr:hypothetical protein [Deinococcus grandis]BBN97242.1 hypothetical protein DEGR_39750 [Deinococcus grandis]GAQ24010.1 hypothetical protein DEIGR_500003 [Deinococcus grandis]
MYANSTTEAVPHGKKPHTYAELLELERRNPYDPGTYASDRWAHFVAAQECGLKKALTRVEDYGTGQTSADSSPTNGQKPKCKRGAAAGELVRELRVLERRYGMLLFITINHPTGLDARCITDGRGTEWGKAVSKRLGTHGWARIEYGGRSIRLHFHAFVPLVLLDHEALAQMEAEGLDIHIMAADLSRHPMYMTKSPYGWTAITDYHRHVTLTECYQATLAYLDGLEDYRARTGKTQPPDGKWWFDGRPSSRGLAPVLPDDKYLTPSWLDRNPTPDEYTDDDAVYLAWLEEQVEHDQRECHPTAGRVRGDEPPRSNPVWTRMMTTRLMPQQRREPVRGGVRGGASLSRALRGPEAGHQEGTGVPQSDPLLPVSLKAQEGGAERLQRPAPLDLTAPRLPQHRAVEPAGVCVPERPAQGRRQPSNSFRPLGRVDVDQITQPVHDVPHVLDDTDTLRVCDFPFINNGVQGISRANGPRF